MNIEHSNLAISALINRAGIAKAELDEIRGQTSIALYTNISEGADDWLRNTYCAGLIAYLHQPCVSIVANHGVPQAIGYLNMLRNQTFDNKIDTVTKTWRRDTLGELITLLETIITPPAPPPEAAAEPEDINDASAQATSATEQG